jgi:hypothetical protein
MRIKISSDKLLNLSDDDDVGIVLLFTGEDLFYKEGQFVIRDDDDDDGLLFI